MERKGGLLLILGVLVLALMIIAALAFLLLTPYGTGGWKKEGAGPIRIIGTFNTSSIPIENVVANVEITPGNVSGVLVKSNLPVIVNNLDGVLTVKCPLVGRFELFGSKKKNLCGRYIHGRIVIETGKEVKRLVVRGSVGDYFISAKVSRLYAEHIVGEIEGTALRECTVENVVGKVSLRVEGNTTVRDVVGDVRIAVPRNFSVQLREKDVVGKVENLHSGSGPLVVINVSNVVGDLTIETG
jgi:hypothetical protein